MGNEHLEQFFINNLPLVIILAVWSLVWKAAALWRAARLSQKGWFVALLVINTLGLLEIFYLYVITKSRDNSKA